ncbi:MAG TPA: hypothetical protein VNN25_02950 [Thermoanaerobaculia bacterium]|nr:hypothetical protein [Thermoanaerobaculia bacterium]
MSPVVLWSKRPEEKVLRHETTSLANIRLSRPSVGAERATIVQEASVKTKRELLQDLVGTTINVTAEHVILPVPKHTPGLHASTMATLTEMGEDMIHVVYEHYHRNPGDILEQWITIDSITEIKRCRT